jgi:hypothetical protein
MASLKTAYGSAGQLITCSLASLANSATAGREGVVVDNTSNNFLDALVMLQVKLQAGTPANDQAVYVYCYGTVDGGATYPDAITGSDAAITFNSPINVALLGTIFTPTSAGTFKGGPWSVCRALGVQQLPAKWGIAVRNYSGIALSATESDHAKLYQGVYASVA